MHAWYDRAPRGVIPSPPRILFDNPDRDSSSSERNSGGSDSERSLGTNPPPELISITPRDERAAEVVPWVRALAYGDRLRLAGFTSHSDRQSVVMREPAFQLHLRQALQMRLTNMRPTHAIYRQREMRFWGDFASGLPIGLAVLSRNVLRAAATARREDIMHISTELGSWHQVRQETIGFISENGVDHPFVPELIQWLRSVGRDIFGATWEVAQLEDHSAPLRTSRDAVLTMVAQVEPVHSLATGPISAPSPGTVDAHDAMYWARTNHFRRTLQEFTRAEAERDLVRRVLWVRLHRPFIHNGRRNAISGPSRGGGILARMSQNPRIQVPGLNDSPDGVVGESEQESIDGGTDTEETAGNGGRASDEGYTAGSEGSDGGSAEQESLEGENSTQSGHHVQVTEQHVMRATSVHRRRHSDSMSGCRTTTGLVLPIRDCRVGVVRNLPSRSSSEPPRRRTRSFCDLQHDPGTDPWSIFSTPGSEPYAGRISDTPGMSRAASRVVHSASPSQTPEVSYMRLVPISETLRNDSEPPLELDFHPIDIPPVFRTASEPLPETDVNVTTGSDWNYPSEMRENTGTSRSSESPLNSETSRSTSEPVPDRGIHSPGLPPITRAATEPVGEMYTDIAMGRPGNMHGENLTSTPPPGAPSDISRNTSASVPERAVQLGFPLALRGDASEPRPCTFPETREGGSLLGVAQPAAADGGMRSTITSNGDANSHSLLDEGGEGDIDNLMPSPVGSSGGVSQTNHNGEDDRLDDDDTTETLEDMVLAQIMEWEIAGETAGRMEGGDDEIESA